MPLIQPPSFSIRRSKTNLILSALRMAKTTAGMRIRTVLRIMRKRMRFHSDSVSSRTFGILSRLRMTAEDIMIKYALMIKRYAAPPSIAQFAFAISFFSLAVMWADWHRELHDVKLISDKTVWSTISVLFFMAFMPYLTGLLSSDFSNRVGQILYGADLLLISLFNSLCYRSLAAIDENCKIRPKLIARANLLFINTAVMLLSVILSLSVLPYCAVIGIIIISILFVLPIFKK